MVQLAPVVASSYHQKSPLYHDRSVARIEDYYGGLLPYEHQLQNHRRKVSEYLDEDWDEDYDGRPVPVERPRMLGDPED